MLTSIAGLILVVVIKRISYDFRKVSPVSIVTDKRGTRAVSIAAAIALLALRGFPVFDDVRRLTVGTAARF